MNKDSYDEEYDWNEGVKVEGGGIDTKWGDH